MSKLDRAKLIAEGPQIKDIVPDAHWTVGRVPTGTILVDGAPMDYWLPDNLPIDEEVPF